MKSTKFFIFSISFYNLLNCCKFNSKWVTSFLPSLPDVTIYNYKKHSLYKLIELLLIATRFINI